MKAIGKLRMRHGMAAGAVALGIVALMWVGISALPTPTQFELDGNAIVDGTGDDWANTVPPPPSAGSEAFASTFIADGSGNSTIFTTGGSKDVNDISQWQFKDQLGGLPDKDNLTNAYSAAYQQGGDLIIYFGADRFTTEGDAQLGFWFFKSQVQAVGGKFVGGDGVTPAVHSNGDILVLANLSNGGTVFTAQVFQWMNGALQGLVTNPGDAHCGSNTDPNVCFTTNASLTTAPWSYTSKDGTTGSFPSLTFFEGAINISHFTAGSPECFSSFMAETRSSTSQSATLKDLALGSFNTCKVSIVKDCPTVTFDEATGLLNYDFNVTVTNDGFGSLFDLVVTDTASGGFATQFTLASLAAGASHTFSGSFSLQPGPSTPNPPTNTASVAAASFPGGQQIVTAGPVSALCPPVSFDANLTITKACTTRLEVQDNRIVVAVDIAGQVCNVPPEPGSPDFPSPIANVTVTDTPPIDPILLGTLQPGECKNYTSTYFPDVLTNGSSLPHDQTFEDTVLVTGTSTLNNQEKQNTATANCPLCPPTAH